MPDAEPVITCVRAMRFLPQFLAAISLDACVGKTHSRFEFRNSSRVEWVYTLNESPSYPIGMIHFDREGL